MLGIFKTIKHLFFDVSLDATVFSLLSLSKKTLTSIVKGFLEKTSSKVTDEVIEGFIALLPATEKDEQCLDDAFIYIETVLKKPTVRKAWADQMELVETLSTDPVEGEKLKEYVRRLSIKETVEKTAQKIIIDTYMSPADYLKYLHGLSIQRKVLEPKYKSFLETFKKNGKEMVAAAQKYNDEVGQEIDKVTDQIKAYNDADEAKLKKWKKWL